MEDEDVWADAILAAGDLERSTVTGRCAMRCLGGDGTWEQPVDLTETIALVLESCADRRLMLPTSGGETIIQLAFSDHFTWRGRSHQRSVRRAGAALYHTILTHLSVSEPWTHLNGPTTTPTGETAHLYVTDGALPALPVQAAHVFAFNEAGQLALVTHCEHGPQLPGGPMPAGCDHEQAAAQQLTAQTGLHAANLQLIGFLHLDREQHDEQAADLAAEESVTVIYQTVVKAPSTINTDAARWHKLLPADAARQPWLPLLAHARRTARHTIRQPAARSDVDSTPVGH